MEFVIILLKSLLIGGLLGFAAGAGAARMFHAPQTQGLGAFRTLGEMNAAQGDPASHFSFGLGFSLMLGLRPWEQGLYTRCDPPDCA